jgi:hypothetical protein
MAFGHDLAKLRGGLVGFKGPQHLEFDGIVKADSSCQAGIVPNLDFVLGTPQNA